MIHHVGVLTLSDINILSVLRLVEPVAFIAERRIEEWSCLCRVFKIGAGSTLFETVIPLGHSPLLKWYLERGTSLHHIALRVPSCKEWTETFRAAGVRMVSPFPVEGVLGWKVNFVHPSVCGVMIEIVEEPQ